MRERNAIIKICQVISVSDNADGDRIKVRLNPEDNRKTNDELPYAYPLLPKMFHVKPKEGEGVLVILSEVGDGYSIRHYIGPIISQPQHMEKDTFGTNCLSLYNGSIKGPDEALRLNPNSNGAFGKEEDIAIYGRKKNDIILSKDDIKIRCGSRIKDSNKPVFNRLDSSFILLRHTDDNKGEQGNEYRSSATIVGDKITLLSNRSNPFNINDPDELITDAQLEKIIKEAHQLPYGDLLVEFLKKFLKAFLEHTHAYPGIVPGVTPIVKEIRDYPFDKILSKDIRIN
jgi:hypothetical protein